MLDDSGHFPHKDHPDEFVRLLDEFITATEPATYSRARFRRMLKAGPTPGVTPAPGPALAAVPDRVAEAVETEPVVTPA